MHGRNSTPLGVHGNAWSAATTGANGTSNAIDLGCSPFVSIFGNTSGASTLTLQLSQNGTDFYDSATTVAANGNFGVQVTVGARYVRLKSGSDVTATATIAAKP